MGMRVRREGVAHGTGHPGLRERHVQPRRGGAVPVKQEIADLHLVHEHFLERGELVRRVLGLVSQRLRWSQHAPRPGHERQESDQHRPQRDHR